MAKTGPKPLPPKEFAAKHAERLNYTLVKILGDREFEVKCNACSKLRIVVLKNNGFGPKCTCTHKRKFYTEKRTAETHTQELHEKGYADYSCLKLGDNPGRTRFESSGYNTYKHSCGHEFSMTFICFKMCKIPCEKCRPWHEKPHDVYVAEVRALTKNIEVLGEYKSRTSIEHRYVKCGHVVMHRPGDVLRSKSPGKCPICYPNRIWHRFKVKGKRFCTRSVVEKEFVKWLVYQKKVPVEKVEYEPSASSVRYYDLIRGTYRRYTPDFKVGNVRVEVKDLASLGLKDYHWQDKDEALIENCSKVAEARAQFDDYRIYVYVKGVFHRAHDFWTIKEKKRLLAL